MVASLTLSWVSAFAGITSFLTLSRRNGSNFLFEWMIDPLLQVVSLSALGRSFLLVGLATATVGMVVAFAGGLRKDERLVTLSKRLSVVFAVGMILANLLMVYALLNNDFSVTYVAKVGSVQTSTYFTIVSLWASLEGSILLWGGVLGIYVLGLLIALGKQHKEYLPWTLGTLLAICVFFAMLVASVADPFKATDPQLLAEMCARYGCQDGMPLDGPGPNPLLQNHWLMAFHPPTLYLGYVGMALPFAMICGALFAGRLEAGWMTPLRRVFLVPWAFLTAGIIMGGWWSYAVLGWGGFWAWDPVENASFMPWLTGTAFIHSAMMMQRRQRLQTWTLILGMVTFLLTLFGTFLTRSGVFNSVHAFAEGPVGPIFLGFVAVMLLFSVVLLSLREHTLYDDDNALPTLKAPQMRKSSRSLKGGLLALVLALGPAVGIVMTLWYSLPATYESDGVEVGLLTIAGLEFSWVRLLGSTCWLPLLAGIPYLFKRTNDRLLGRELSIILQNFSFCAFTFVVMMGTVYPILAEALADKKISVGEPYFDRFAFPIGMVLIALMAIGPALPWGRAAVDRAWMRFAVPLAGALITPVVLLATGVDKPYVILSVALCVFALIANLDEFILPVRHRMKTQKESLPVATWYVAKQGRRRFGGHIAHIGVIMAVLSMAAAKGYRHEAYFTTGPGNEHEFAEYTLTFEDTRVVEEGFRRGVLGDFRVKRNGKDLGIHSPRINHYATRMEPLPAPVSLGRWNHDLQLTLMSADEDGSFAYLRVIRTPFMMWLWFSALVMVIGTLFSVWPSRKKETRNHEAAA